MTEEAQVDNLKEDFIWFRPGVNKLSVMECTCGQFLEHAMSTDSGLDFLAKAAARHARKTGHTLRPRGN